ncbi:MAG: TIGR01212 family radical SAM protein [Halanaerobiales bacterium]
MTIYFKYSEYLKDKYGEKTYKLPINLPVTCPNRDGVVGTGGCSFCGEEAAGFENLSNKYSVKEQLRKNKEYIGEKYGADLFVAYFQNFTNTYMPLDELKSYIQESLEVEGIVEISLSTRPDCISEDYIKQINALISQAEKDINLSLELGLQTVNYHTLEELNRGHTLAEFIDAIMIARKYSVDVGVHLIPNLPGDNMLDVKENARILSALGISNVKLHALYIREDTELGELYKEGALSMISLEEYIDRVITFLEYLDPDIAVQRLLGRAPEENTLFVNWDHSWWKIQDMILKEMKKRGSYQGKKFDYLNGKALKKFEN